MQTGKDIRTYKPQEDSVVVYRSADNAIQLEVQLAEETVWLTQQQMADLFGVQIPAISKHLANIFREGELSKDSVISILENTAADGKRYRTMFYKQRIDNKLQEHTEQIHDLQNKVCVSQCDVDILFARNVRCFELSRFRAKR